MSLDFSFLSVKEKHLSKPICDQTKQFHFSKNQDHRKKVLYPIQVTRAIQMITIIETYIDGW